MPTYNDLGLAPRAAVARDVTRVVFGQHPQGTFDEAV
jgi:hypothetical protein